jgi:hypothetical protein
MATTLCCACHNDLKKYTINAAGEVESSSTWILCQHCRTIAFLLLAFVSTHACLQHVTFHAQQLIYIDLTSLRAVPPLSLLAGRKMQQLSNQLGSRATAAQSDTAAKINAAIDNNMHVKPSQTPKNMVTTASVHTPKPAPGSATAAISSAPKTSQGAAQAAGQTTAAQSATEAKIGEAASGSKPAKPAAKPTPKPTTMIATTSKTMQGGAEAAGRSTAGQAATAAAINAAASGTKPSGTKP